MRSLYYMPLVLVLVMLGAWFACLNADNVQVNYIVGTAELPLIALLFVFLVIGALLGGGSTLSTALHIKYRNRVLRRSLETAERQLKKMHKED